MSISVVLPCYNEGENLQLLLPSIVHELGLLNTYFEIIVVDIVDGKDLTESIAKSFSSVKYFVRSPTNSYGDAVRTAIDKANTEYIIFMDADCSHDPKQISKMYNQDSDFDVVISSRYIKNGQNNNSFRSRYMSLLLNFVYRILFGIDCLDISNSFKRYKCCQLKKLNLICNNFDIIQEMLIKLSKMNGNFKIIEIPSSFTTRKNGKSKRNYFKLIISYISLIIRLKILNK